MPFHRLRYRTAYTAAAIVLGIFAGGSAAASDLSAVGRSDAAPVERSERFVVAEAFAIGGRIGEHAVSAVGFSFQTYFSSLVEINTADAPIDAWTLGRSADDTTLIAMIGGEGKVVVSLSAIHRVMARGLRGDNHTDGKSNFAYARSPVDGRVWAIHWTLNEAGEWVVGAVFVPHPDIDWPAGARLFAPRIGGEDQRAERCSRARLACVARP